MTKFGTSVRQRDIVLVSLPFSDYSHEKTRPALVISSEQHNSHNEDVICCAITSNPREDLQAVDISNNDMDSGFLKKDSKVKPAKIFSIHYMLIEHRIARLGLVKTREVIDRLSQIIAVD